MIGTEIGGRSDALATEAEMEHDAFIEGLDDAHGDGPWTAGRLVATLKALAAREGDAFPDLFAAAVASARDVAAGSELEVARVRDELDRMRRERLLPDAPTLDRLVRYETALNRMLYQALNQLEAMQQRRAGAPVPLHRVQTYGLP